MKEQLKLDIRLNKEYKEKQLMLERKIAELRYTRLKLVYEYKVEKLRDIRFFEAKIDYLKNKSQFVQLEKQNGKLDCNIEKLSKANSFMERKISTTRMMLQQYNELDQRLLAEYRDLRDEIDCQEMLVELSQANT